MMAYQVCCFQRSSLVFALSCCLAVAEQLYAGMLLLNAAGESICVCSQHCFHSYLYTMFNCLNPCNVLLCLLFYRTCVNAGRPRKSGQFEHWRTHALPAKTHFHCCNANQAFCINVVYLLFESNVSYLMLCICSNGVLLSICDIYADVIQLHRLPAFVFRFCFSLCVECLHIIVCI